MKRSGINALMILCIFYTCVKSEKYITPEQIHLSYGVDPTRMVVTWSTMNATQTSVAQIGPSEPKKPPSVMVKGSSSKFVDPGTLHHTQYIHRVEFSGLKPGAAYIYRVGTAVENIWSETFIFRTMKEGSDWSPHVALYGDFGLSNAQSLERLMNDSYKGMYDAVFHVGDFAYDMDSDNGYTGDKFMNMIQNLSARLPYMTCPGNHENKYNFTHYKKRFTMPGDEDGNNMFYSFDIGPAHVISISTEYYFFLQDGIAQAFRQYYWLENELKEANKPENRAKRPWVITMGHRPMYCSNNNKDDCTKHHSWVRDGIPLVDKYGLEEMFYENGVDLAVWAHEHSYERLWPLYKDKVYNGSLEQPYRNPGAPVHITTGSAGCQENHDPFKPKPADWSAFRSDDYGYTRMKIFNSTHLYLEQVSDDKNGTVIDKIMIIKDKHGSYGNQKLHDGSDINIRIDAL